MSNTLTPLSPTYWSRIMGRKLFKSTVYRSIASFREEATLTDGQIVDRPYRSDISVEIISRGTALNQQDLTTTSDTLTVNKYLGALFNVDKIDKAQNKWDAARVFAEDAAKKLAQAIDADVLAEVRNTTHTVDYNDIDSNQTAGLPVPVTSANVFKLFTIASRKLNKNNVDQGNRFAVISAEVHQALLEYVGGKETALGDKTSEYGNMGKYMGFDLYMSNNLAGSARWTPANQPSDGDTITIEGVVFTFEDGSLDAAGKVKSETNTATTLDHLVAFINSGGVATTTDGYALSAANQRICRTFVAVDGTTYVDVYVKGTPNVTVAASEANDPWSHKMQHNVFGQKGAIDVVTQLSPSVEFASRVSAGILGTNALPYTLYGTKLFYDEIARVVDVQVDSSNY